VAGGEEEIMTIRKRRSAGDLFAAILIAGLMTATALPALAQDDPGRLMRRGHEALDAQHYAAAADAFRRAAEAAEENRQQAEALYWQAFALHRQGGRDELARAAAALGRLDRETTAAELHREARALAARIKADLAQMGDAQAGRELAELAQEHEELELKLMALQGVMNMNPERARPILAEILQRRDPDTVELRRQAIYLLMHGGAEDVEELVIEVVREDTDREVRATAVHLLAQSGSEQAVGVLIDVVLNGDDSGLQSEAIYALSRHDNERVAAVLRQVAVDPAQDPEIREVAIFWLGQDGSAEHLAFLRQLYGELQDAELKERVLHGIAQSEAPGVAEWMAQIALSEQEDLEARKMALYWAGRNGQLPVPRLVEIYREVDDRALREQTIYVLAQDGGEAAVTALMDIARTEADLELRKQAVFWIGQTGGERAEQFLLEIIEN
jgi:HEAT repeat protein